MYHLKYEAQPIGIIIHTAKIIENLGYKDISSNLRTIESQSHDGTIPLLHQEGLNPIHT